MGNWLRLRRQSHAPKHLDGTETVYAAADGTLKHMAPDGTVGDLTSGGGGGSQAMIPYGPIPVAYNSPNIGTTGFPVLDVLAGDIVIGWGNNLITPWDVAQSFAHGIVHVTDSSGLSVVNGGDTDFFNTENGDSDAQTLSEVFDGWTLIKNDTQLVLVMNTAGDTPAAGEADLYIVVMRPVAP